MNYEILQGDCIQTMKGLKAGSVQCCVTSPPYFNLRDYQTATWEGGDPNCDHKTGKTARNDGGVGGRNGPTSQAKDGGELFYINACGKCGARRIDNQIGLEETPDAYVAKLVDVFREVRRVLHPTGTVWCNLGDSYASQGGEREYGSYDGGTGRGPGTKRIGTAGLKPKDLIGIPWMVAFALRADGWYLRSEIIWHKKSCMPESVTDRPTKAHEQVFLLSKSPRYYYDHIAIAEEGNGRHSFWATDKHDSSRRDGGRVDKTPAHVRNKRSVWTLGPEPYHSAHFATMPTKLVEPCILAGSSSYGACADCGAPWERVVEVTGRTATTRAERNATYGNNTRNPDPRDTVKSYSTALEGSRHRQATTTGWQPTCTCNADVVPCTVLDPFSGAATVGLVALKHHRRYIGLELNESYIALSHDRLRKSQPLLLEVI